MMGGANYHCWIIFDDGVKWLVRIPRTTTCNDMPPELEDYIVKSEYATLRFLENTSIPAPKVYGYGLASDPENKVGVAYILEEAMPGNRFDAHDATDEQKLHV